MGPHGTIVMMLLSKNNNKSREKVGERERGRVRAENRKKKRMRGTERQSRDREDLGVLGPFYGHTHLVHLVHLVTAGVEVSSCRSLKGNRWDQLYANSMPVYVRHVCAWYLRRPEEGTHLLEVCNSLEGRQLWAVMLVLGTEPGFPATASALNHLSSLKACFLNTAEGLISPLHLLFISVIIYQLPGPIFVMRSLGPHFPQGIQSSEWRQSPVSKQNNIHSALFDFSYMFWELLLLVLFKKLELLYNKIKFIK